MRLMHLPAHVLTQTALGPRNPFTPVNNPTGRRQINWDALPATRGVSDDTSSNFPGEFFNAAVNPRARGALCSTPVHTSMMRLSSDPQHTGDGVAPLFGQPTEFSFFSVDPQSATETQRIIGVTNCKPGSGAASPGCFLDVHFRDPANPERQAYVDGFGSVFTGTNVAGLSKIEFFDIDANLLHTVNVPVSGDGMLAFAGAKFASPVVAYVRITAGNLGIDQCSQESATDDCVAMDDFIYGEPKLVQVLAANRAQFTVESQGQVTIGTGGVLNVGGAPSVA